MVFKPGYVLRLSDDFSAMREEAVRFEKKHGRYVESICNRNFMKKLVSQLHVLSLAETAVTDGLFGRFSCSSLLLHCIAVTYFEVFLTSFLLFVRQPPSPQGGKLPKVLV